MARRVSSSQLRSAVRRAQQQSQQAVRRLESDLRRQQQQARSAVNRVNSEIRAYNARVRAKQRALDAALSRLTANAQSSPSSRTTVVRRSQTLHRSYVVFSERVDSQRLSPTYNVIADLAEREVANDLIVTNLLLGDREAATEPVSDAQDAEFADRLQRIDPELDRRWRGAVFALNPKNPDAVRHFCVSAREIVTGILDIFAPVDAVLAATPGCVKTAAGHPVRRERVLHMLRRHDISDETLVQFVDDDVASVVTLVNDLNDGAHGTTDTFGAAEFAKVRKRVAGALNFLSALGTGSLPNSS